MQLNMQSSSSSSNNNTNNQEAATDKPSTSKQANNNNVAAQQQQRASSPSDSSSASSSSFDSLCNIGPEDGIKAYIKIGPDYQVDLAPYNMKLYKDSDRPNIAEKADLIWRPSEKVSDKQMDQYLSEVINEHAYNIHQAIGLLNFCDHDISKATALSRKLKPKPEEWTKEEKVMFEHAFWFHGKNFNKIKLLLPHKSQASLVNYYYTWKKTRMQKSLMDYQMDLKSANSNSGVDQNNGNGSGRNGGAHNGDELNENGVVYEELDLTEKSDDNDSIDENENGSGKICCNCDFITTDLQSTVKGMLCNPCYAYFKESGGLMRPDSIVNKTNVGVGGSTSSQQQPHGHLSTSAFRTNRFLTITNNGNSSSGSVNVDNATQQSSSSNSAQGLSKDAKSFHKSLRKPPKGIYLNYEELVELAKDDTRKVFNQLNRRISALKKQANKQEIDEFMTKANATENEPFRSEINNLLCEIEERISVAPTTGWTQKEVLYALRAFSKYGNNFEIISLIIPTKPESSIRAFYYYYKDIYNLDKLVLNSDELEKISDEIHKEVNDKLTAVVASSNEEAAMKSS